MTMTILPESPPRGTPNGPSRRVVVAVVAAVVAVGVAAAFLLGLFGGSSKDQASTSVLSSMSGEQILERAHAAAMQSGALHLEGLATVSGREIRYDQDGNRTSGVQHITSGQGRGEVRVIGDTTYFTGNRDALINYFEIAATDVPSSGSWFRLTQQDQQYDTVTEGVTLPSILGEVEVAGPLTVLPVTERHGVSVVGVRGGIDGAPSGSDAVATLWVAATGPTLPVEYDARAAQVSMSATFSNWGHSTDVVRPARIVPMPMNASQALTHLDAQMRINLRNLAVAEEVYLTENGNSSAGAHAMRQQTLGTAVKLAKGQTITVHLDTTRGYCLAGMVIHGRYFIYSSEEGGMSAGPAKSDTCSPSLYPKDAGKIRV